MGEGISSARRRQQAPGAFRLTVLLPNMATDCAVCLVVAPFGAAPGADGGVLALLLVDADVGIGCQAAKRIETCKESDT